MDCVVKGEYVVRGSGNVKPKRALEEGALTKDEPVRVYLAWLEACIKQ